MRIPISGKKLAERWGIQPIDLFFLMWNHDLHFMDQDGNMYDVKDLIDFMPKDERLDIEDLHFLLSEIEKLEKAFSGLQSNRQKVIRGRSLMKEWDIDEFELYTIVSQKRWNFVDPFGFSIGNEFLLSMCAHGGFSISEAFFSSANVDDFEKEGLFQVSKRDDEVINPPGAVINEVDRNDDVPIVSFYKNGQMWKIGEKGKEKEFKHLKGFEFIRFLLRHEKDEFYASEVYYCGDVPDEVKSRRYSKESVSKALAVLLERKREMEEQLQETFYPEDREKIEADIEMCEKYIRDASKKSKSASGDLRLTVRKCIKTAIDTIAREAEDFPSLKPIVKYLSLENPDKRIKTGYRLWYRQDPTAPVKWILFPTEL